MNRSFGKCSSQVYPNLLISKNRDNLPITSVLQREIHSIFINITLKSSWLFCKQQNKPTQTSQLAQMKARKSFCRISQISRNLLFLVTLSYPWKGDANWIISPGWIGMAYALLAKVGIYVYFFTLTQTFLENCHYFLMSLLLFKTFLSFTTTHNSIPRYSLFRTLNLSFIRCATVIHFIFISPFLDSSLVAFFFACYVCEYPKKYTRGRGTRFLRVTEVRFILFL